MGDTMEILRALFDKIQTTKVNASESLLTDNSRTITGGTNTTKGKAQLKREQATYSNETTQNKKEIQAKWEMDLIGSVFNAEGGYSSDKKDTGNYDTGKTTGNFVGTNHGVSAPLLGKYLGRKPTVKDMKALTQDKAAGIYKDQFYDKFGIAELPKNLQEITLHSVVNSGRHGVKVIQDLLGFTGSNIDGLAGPNTRKAMRKASFTKAQFRDKLMKRYKTFKTWSSHGKGWKARFDKLAE